LFTLTVGFHQLNAQPNVLGNYKNRIFAEVAGTSIGYSFNLEKIFLNRRTYSLATRAGIGATPNDVYIPAGVEAFFFSGFHHLIVMPTVAVHVVMSERYSFTNTDTFLEVNAGIGYRYQSPSTPVFFQVVYTPSVEFDPTSIQFTEAEPVYRGRFGLGVGFKL